MCRGERPRVRGAVFLAWLALFPTGCRDYQMADQPRYEALEPSTLFEDGMSARPLPAGVVAFGAFREDLAFHTGMTEDGPVSDLPAPLTAELLERGRERYNIFCSPCHDEAGTGVGMVVRRGFDTLPPSFHIPRLREAPPGHYFDVITHGFGAMSSYAHQAPPADRWAIVAYIRALQLSQFAPIEAAPPGIREQLEAER